MYGCLWCLINIGNVKSKSPWPLFISTGFLTSYLAWFSFQTELAAGYDNIGEYETACGKLIYEQNFPIGVAITVAEHAYAVFIGSSTYSDVEYLRKYFSTSSAARGG